MVKAMNRFDEMDDVTAVMWLTGWRRETAQNAVSSWKRLDPTWNDGRYVQELLSRFVQVNEMLIERVSKALAEEGVIDV